MIKTNLKAFEYMQMTFSGQKLIGKIRSGLSARILRINEPCPKKTYFCCMCRSDCVNVQSDQQLCYSLNVKYIAASIIGLDKRFYSV